MKRLFIFIQMLVAFVAGVSAQELVEAPNYTQDFNTLTSSVTPEGWTKFGSFSVSTSTSSGRHSSTGKAWYSAGRNLANSGEKLGYISPEVKGDVTFYAKALNDWQITQGNVSLQVFEKIGDDFTEVWSNDQNDSQKALSGSDYVKISLNSTGYTQYLIVAGYTYVSDFSADFAKVPAKRLLTIVSGTTTPSGGKVSVDENNKVVVSGSVKVRNDGNIALTTADENYKVDIVDYGHNNILIANVTLPTTLAAGEEADCSFSGEIVIPENPTLNSSGEYRSRVDAKEYLGGTSKMISSAWLDIMPYIANVDIRYGSNTYDPAKTVNYGTFSGSKASQFRIKNLGSKPLVVTGANCGEGISTDLEFPVTLNAEEELYFNITLSSATTKAIAGTVELVSNADKGTTTISVAGACVAEGTYFVDFEDGKIPEGWYKGSTNWTIETLGYSYQTDTNKKVLTNGSQSPLLPITTCKLHMKAGEALSFQVAKRTNYGGELAVSYATERNGEWTEALHLGYNAEHGTTILPSATNEYALYSVAVPAEGDYYFKFEAGYVYINDVFGGEPVAVAHDVVPVSFTAAAPYTVNYASELEAKFDNANTAAESGYKVEFIVDEEVVATLEGEDIAVGGSKSFSASYTPHAAGEHVLVAKLTSEDGTSVCTESLTINVAPESLTNDVTVGTVTTSSSTSVPFYSNYRNSTSEFIYTADRLQTEAGKIVKIAYPYYNTAGDNYAMVRIWLQNTEDATVGEKLTDKDQMTLVYENKNFKFPKAGSSGNFTNLEFTLDEGFDYTGGNLRVVVERYATEYKSYYFAAEALKSGEKILYKYTDTYGGKTTNEEVQQGDYLSTASLNSKTSGTYFPIIILGMEAEPVKLSGTVTYKTIAVEGATVEAKSDNVIYTATTDAEGKYTMDIIQSSLEYVVTVTADGYDPFVSETMTIAENKTYDVEFPAPTSVIVPINPAIGYATFYDSKHPLKLPENAEVYIMVQIDVNSEPELVSYKEYAQGIFGTLFNNVIPAGEPIVIKASSDVTLEYGENTTGMLCLSTFGMNFLMGTDEETLTCVDNSYLERYKLDSQADSYFYALSLNKEGNPESVGFYWMNEFGDAFVSKAHKAFLAIPKFMFGTDEANVKKAFLFNDDATGIKNVKVNRNDNKMFNIAGQRVNGNVKGIVIKNGKKFMVK